MTLRCCPLTKAPAVPLGSVRLCRRRPRAAPRHRHRARVLVHRNHFRHFLRAFVRVQRPARVVYRVVSLIIARLDRSRSRARPPRLLRSRSRVARRRRSTTAFEIRVDIFLARVASRSSPRAPASQNDADAHGRARSPRAIARVGPSRRHSRRRVRRDSFPRAIKESSDIRRRRAYEMIDWITQCH